jgi:DNA-directed RNA polymerase specialized sigma24 family protein
MITAEMKISPDPASADALEIEEDYRRIRKRLTRFFSAERCPDPDGLADETIYRALRAFASGATLTGKLEPYLFGIAINVVKEIRRRQFLQVPLDELAEVASDSSDDLVTAIDRVTASQLLQRCLGQLKPEQRKLFLDYYDIGAEGEIKQDRKIYAKQFGISTKALTNRVLRIKDRLEECLKRLMQNQ